MDYTALLTQAQEAESKGKTSPEPVVKKRKKNISRACTVCRRRRTKCDGQPRCATCVAHDEQCTYDPDQDGRKPATKLYVEALVNRVRALEQELEETRANLGLTSPHGHAHAHAQGHVRREAVGDSPLDETSPLSVLSGRSARSAQASTVVGTTGALRIEEDVLTHHGPTSAYMHIPDRAREREADSITGPARPHVETTRVEGDPVDWSALPWDMHLPPGAIPSVTVHNELLSVFFSYMNDWTWWIDEDAFYEGMYRGITTLRSRDAHYSPLLHNTILSLACQISPETVSPTADTRQSGGLAAVLAAHARGMIDDEAGRPQLSTAKGMMLLGAYSWSIGSHSLGWFYEGIGARMAQALGLNADSTSLVARGAISPATKVARDRCFWTIYLQDQLWSLTVGRTAALSTEDFETPLPEIDPEIDAAPWLDHTRRLQRRKGLDIRGPPSWTSTVFLYSCRLALIADRIHSAIYRIRSHMEDQARTHIISELHLDLHTWFMELPSPLRLESTAHPGPHVLICHAMARYLQILLHRPTYTQPGGVDDPERELAVKTCNVAAAEILRCLRLYRQSPGLQYVSTSLSNVTFTAATIFLLAAVQSSESSKAHAAALASSQECIASLRTMCWTASKFAADILENMQEEWFPPIPTPPPVSIPPILPPLQDTRPTGSVNGRGDTLPENVAPAVVDSLGGLGKLSDLNDVNSDLAKLLTSIGWQPPPQPSPMTTTTSIPQASNAAAAAAQTQHVYAHPRPHPHPHPPVRHHQPQANTQTQTQTQDQTHPHSVPLQQTYTAPLDLSFRPAETVVPPVQPVQPTDGLPLWETDADAILSGMSMSLAATGNLGQSWLGANDWLGTLNPDDWFSGR